MRERVLGIETEYAVVYFPARGEGEERPTNLALYPLFEEALAGLVPSVPRAFSLLRAKPGRFLANGMSFHYEGTPQHFEHGLLEIASPECRDPFTLLAHERAKDALAEELRERVNRELARRGWLGEVRLFKNNVDSQGHTFGSHESYWIDDPLAGRERLAVLPLWLLCWFVTVPALAWIAAFGVAIVLAPFALLALPLLGVALRGVARLLEGPREGWAARMHATGRRLERLPLELGERLAADPAWLVRKLAWVEWPMRPAIRLHAALYARFFFRPVLRGATAFLVTRSLYAGAGTVAWGQERVLQLSQRARHLRVLTSIFTHGDRRPVFELRDLFFRPWSALGRKRRLHLMLGDANLCDAALVLRTGATALVLEAIEARPDAPWPELVDPLGAMRAVSADPEAPLRLRTGAPLTALDVQRRCLELVRQALGRPEDAWKQRVLDLWDEVLQALEREPRSLADRVDWIAKQSLLERDAPAPPDWETLAQRGAGLVLRRELEGEDARLRELAFRMLRTDLRYHELGPRGGHRRLRERGAIAELAEAEAVGRARDDGPADTRAFGRGRAIREAADHGESAGATWHRVRRGWPRWVWFVDPLRPRGWPR